LALESIAKACGEIGPESMSILKEALEAARGIGDEEYRRKALQSIAKACGEIGPKSLDILKEALEAARGIGDEKYRRWALQSIALAYFEIGKEKESISILEEALESARGIGNELYRRKALQSIAKAWRDFINNYNLSPYLLNSYKHGTLSEGGKKLLGLILEKDQIESIAKDNYDKALMLYGFCLPLLKSDPQVLNWAKSKFNAEQDVETKKHIGFNRFIS
jgi:tetratricopeptide (TPR) repeat protein